MASPPVRAIAAPIRIGCWARAGDDAPNTRTMTMASPRCALCDLMVDILSPQSFVCCSEPLRSAKSTVTCCSLRVEDLLGQVLGSVGLSGGELAGCGPLAERRSAFAAELLASRVRLLTPGTLHQGLPCGLEGSNGEGRLDRSALRGQPALHGPAISGNTGIRGGPTDSSNTTAVM